MPQPLQYATFWQRLTAFMLDIFIIALPAFTIVLTSLTPFFFDISALKNASNKDFELIYQLYKHGVFISVAGLAAVAAILAIFTTSRWQATPGKRLVNIYVATRTNTRLKFGDAFGRFISLPLFILMLQIFERRANYTVLDKIKLSKQPADLQTLESYLNGPLAQITSITVFLTIIVWFSKIFFDSEKAAMHDTLFNTRVFKGKR